MICVQLRQERHEALEARLMPLLTQLGLSWNPIYRYAAPNGAFRPPNLCRASTVPKTEMRPVEWEAPQFLYSASFRGLRGIDQIEIPSHQLAKGFFRAFGHVI